VDNFSPFLDKDNQTRDISIHNLWIFSFSLLITFFLPPGEYICPNFIKNAENARKQKQLFML